MPRQSRTPYVALGMLIERPYTGYALRKAIQQSLGHFWHESYGQLYPALRSLVDSGLATVEEERGGARPDRKVYAITDAGRAALGRWLAEPPAPSVQRNELLLKLYFSPRSERAAAALPDHLASRRHDLSERRERLIGRLTDAEGEPLAAATLRYRLRMVEAELDWIDDAASLVDEALIEA